MTDKMNLKAANARPSPPSITGEPGKGDIARATGGVGDRASSPARDNSLLPERVTLLSSGESRKVNESLRLDAGFEGAGGLVAQTPDTAEPAGDHIGDGNKMGGPGGLISRAAAVKVAAEWWREMKEPAQSGPVAAALRALPAAAQGEPVAWQLKDTENCEIDYTGRKELADSRRTTPGFVVTPLYAHPSDASLREEVERLRKTVKNLNAAWESCIVEREAAEARIAELEAECPALIAAAPDWAEAARHMLETFDAWFSGDARDQSEAAHRLILAGSFAAQAFEDLSASGATADGAPVGMMRTFLLALIDPALPELDPLRACNRTPADALLQPAQAGEG